jgi:hypothetical protein
MPQIPERVARPIRPSVLDALTQLVRASEYARDLGADPWQFALEWKLLSSQGLERSDVRWLVSRGYVELKREISVPAAFSRQFVDPDVPRLWNDTAFVLTDSGVAFARAFTDQPVDTDSSPKHTPTAPAPVLRQEASPKPTWDRDRRELRYRGELVKAFRVPAPNQELILEAFEEEGWPEFIDDPLPPAADQDPHRRLQATIKSLNRRQAITLIRFRGNGGERVFWQALKP